MGSKISHSIACFSVHFRKFFCLTILHKNCGRLLLACKWQTSYHYPLSLFFAASFDPIKYYSQIRTHENFWMFSCLGLKKPSLQKIWFGMNHAHTFSIICSWNFKSFKHPEPQCRILIKNNNIKTRHKFYYCTEKVQTRRFLSSTFSRISTECCDNFLDSVVLSRQSKCFMHIALILSVKAVFVFKLNHNKLLCYTQI